MAGCWLLSLLSIVVFFTIGCPSQLPLPPIPAKGGESFRLLVDRPPSHFLQTDPRWADETIGGSEEPVSLVGCTLCSVAMALNRVGVQSDPSTLNSALKSSNGYNEQGWLLWRAVTPASGNRARARYYARFDHRTIDGSVRDGCIPVIKFFLASGVSHWVVVVGKSGTDYLVRDPLDVARRPVPLSKLTDQIHGFRCVEKQ